MGSDFNIINWYAIPTIWVIMILNLLSCSSFSLVIKNVTHINYPTNLDDYLYNYSSNSLPKEPHTGLLYNISLPANFSGMKVSVLRLRSSTLWYKGANFSSFDLPPKTITKPYVKRLAFMYENLGNLSSQYFDLPGYTIVTKIIGFAVYNASSRSGKTSLERLNVTLIGGEAIKVKFSLGEILSNVMNNTSNKLKKCVRFDLLNGVVELADMLKPNVCISQGVGHFAIAMPKVNDSGLPPPSSSTSPSPLSSSIGETRPKSEKKIALWVWWVVGFVGGMIGLMLLVFCIVVGYKSFVSRKIQRMERTSEKSESLDVKWIGNSKLPFAPVTRTQAILENHLAP